MTEQEVDRFEKVFTQLDSLHSELTSLTKKSTNDALNKFKLRFVNQTIAESNVILGPENIPFKNFEKFDEDDIPTNSDVTMMVGQYLNCMEKIRSDNITRHGAFWYWYVNGKESDIRTAHPKKLK